MKKDLTITVEGIPISGKSTIIALISKALDKKGFDNILVASPDEEEIIKKIHQPYELPEKIMKTPILIIEKQRI